MKSVRPAIGNPGRAIVALAMCVLQSKTVADDGVWPYVDVNSGASAYISVMEGKVAIAEEALSATFCKEGSDAICVLTDYFEFAIPRNVGDRTEWVYSERRYCVTQRYRQDLQGKGGFRFVIFSTSAKTPCDSDSGFDQVAIYSELKGLELISRDLAEDGELELFLVGEKGFGVK